MKSKLQYFESQINYHQPLIVKQFNTCMMFTNGIFDNTKYRSTVCELSYVL